MDKNTEEYYYFSNEKDFIIRKISYFDNKNFECETYCYYDTSLDDGLHIKFTSYLFPYEFLETEKEGFTKVTDNKYKDLFSKVGKSYDELCQRIRDTKNEYNSKIKNYFLNIK